MAVNVIRYRWASSTGWAVADDTTLHRLDISGTDTASLLAHATEIRRGGRRSGEVVPADEIQVLSPVTPDRQFLCQAVNYRSHMRETGFDPVSSPFNIFFTKASSSIAPADTDIVCPERVDYLDYEVEIGLVLSRTVTGPQQVRPSDLGDQVAALVAVNDVSARDVQLAETQFHTAKSYRTFGPVGPHLTLVDGDDLARFAELRLRLWVNGEIRQDEYAADMVHLPAPTLSELSRVQDWAPGDLLATGTPGGCALEVPAWPLRTLVQSLSPRRRDQVVRRSARHNSRRLRHGDLVEVHIGTDDGAIDLGRQRCRVLDGAARGG